MHPNTHKLLLILFVVVTSLLGIGAVLDPEVLPAKYAGAAAIATGALVFLQGLIVRVGDALDDGKLNGSFEPEKDETGIDFVRAELRRVQDKSASAPPAKPGSKGPGAWTHSNFFWVLMLCAVLPCLLGSCAALKRSALTAAEGALVAAGEELEDALADWSRVSEAGSPTERIAKMLAVQAARAVFDEAQQAVALERAALVGGVQTTRVSEGPLWELEGGVLTR